VLRAEVVAQVVPPFTALLRKWRPCFSGMDGFCDFRGHSPFSAPASDAALSLTASPQEVRLRLPCASPGSPTCPGTGRLAQAPLRVALASLCHRKGALLAPPARLQAALAFLDPHWVAAFASPGGINPGVCSPRGGAV